MIDDLSFCPCGMPRTPEVSELPLHSVEWEKLHMQMHLEKFPEANVRILGHFIELAKERDDKRAA